jgi:hypothetical protein
MRSLYPLLLGLLVVGLTACDTTDTDTDPDPDPLTVETVEDLAADPAVRDPETGETSQTGRFTLFNLRTGEVVLDYTDADRSDSLSTNWDIAFQGTSIIANATPESEGGIQIVSGTFEEITEAPTTGYAEALPGGSDAGWYNYAGPPTHLITPIAGTVLVVRTADGRYAKVRIISYYEGNPELPNAFEDADRHYTFEYVFQPDGSTAFPTE